MFAKVVSVVAAVMAGAALAVSLLHAGPAGQSGPRGPRGPAGNTGQNADVAHLGVCESFTTETLDNYNPVVTVITSVDVYAPILTDGVPSCPTGSFVSIVPQQG